MRKSIAIFTVALATAAAVPPAAAEGEGTAAGSITARAGQMLYTTSGRPLVAIYKLTAGGDPQVVVERRLVIVPKATLSMSGGKLTTSLSIADLRRMAPS